MTPLHDITAFPALTEIQLVWLAHLINEYGYDDVRVTLTPKRRIPRIQHRGRDWWSDRSVWRVNEPDPGTTLEWLIPRDQIAHAHELIPNLEYHRIAVHGR